MKGPSDFDAAKKEFAKKFKDKTKNDWDKRSAFVPYPKKYTLIEMEGGDDEEEEKMVHKFEISDYLFENELVSG